jgi:hypothetical protein
MTRAVAGNSTRGHFSTFSDELRDRPDILVIDLQGFVGAETTHFTPEHRSSTRRPLFVVRSLPVWPRAAHLSLCHRFAYLAIKRLSSPIEKSLRPGFGFCLCSLGWCSMLFREVLRSGLALGRFISANGKVAQDPIGEPQVAFQLLDCSGRGTVLQ